MAGKGRRSVAKAASGLRYIGGTRVPASWNIHYDRRVIEDGEPEREAGEQFHWQVLSFGPKDQLARVVGPTQSAVEAPGHRYRVVAQVVYVSESAVVIDFGLRAVGDRHLMPAGTQVGEYLAGEIMLFFQHWCHPLPDADSRCATSRLREDNIHPREARAILCALLCLVLPGTVNASCSSALAYAGWDDPEAYG